MDTRVQQAKDDKKDRIDGPHPLNGLLPLLKPGYDFSLRDDASENDFNGITQKTARRKEEGKKGRWLKAEHELFIQGCLAHGNNWKKVKQIVKTRTSAQIRSHAQKYLIKLTKKHSAYLGSGDVRAKKPTPYDRLNSERSKEDIERKILSIFQPANRSRTREDQSYDTSKDNSVVELKNELTSIPSDNQPTINGTSTNTKQQTEKTDYCNYFDNTATSQSMPINIMSNNISNFNFQFCNPSLQPAYSLNYNSNCAPYLFSFQPSSAYINTPSLSLFNYFNLMPNSQCNEQPFLQGLYHNAASFPYSDFSPNNNN